MSQIISWFINLEIEEYGREQEVDPENSDDAKEMEENGISESYKYS